MIFFEGRLDEALGLVTRGYVDTKLLMPSLKICKYNIIIILSMMISGFKCEALLGFTEYNKFPV